MSLSSKLLRTKPLEGSHDGGSELARSVGLFSLTMLGVGSTIGTGIFFTMAEAVPKAGPAVVIAFLLAALTAGLTALCYAELASSIPASGSAYSYAYATVANSPPTSWRPACCWNTGNTCWPAARWRSAGRST